MIEKRKGKTKKINSASKEKALKLVEFILEKKGLKPVILEIGQLSTLCDYFVVCSGDSGRHARGIYEGIVKQCHESAIKIDHCEDDFIGRWIIVDLGDVMVHIFDQEAREFYNLERLWSGAKKLRISKKKIETKKE